MSTTHLFHFAGLLYFVGTVLYILYLVRLKTPVARTAGISLFIGLLIHILAFILRFRQLGYLPIASIFESLSFFSLCIVGVFLGFQWKYRLFSLGGFISPISLAFVIIASPLTKEPARNVEILKSIWFPIHVLLSFSSEAIFAIAFAAGIMYLLQERELKRKKFGLIYKRLPSLEVLDNVNHACLSIGFTLLTLGIITGAAWANSAWGSYWSWDQKQTWSLAVWLMFAALIHARFFAGWRGRRVAIMVVVVFIIVIFTFIGANFLSERHRFM